MTENFTLQPLWAGGLFIFLNLLNSTSLDAQMRCPPNCQDINVSITGTGPNEFHAKISWTDFIRNFDCAAPVTYALQTVSGANVARGSSDDAGNEVYFIVGNPCDYLGRELMLTVTNNLGSCMSMVTFHEGMLNFTGRSFDMYCDDPRLVAPSSQDIPTPLLACMGLEEPRWVADWATVRDCAPGLQDTAKIIYREWEAFGKDDVRYASYDTLVVHRLPMLDASHLYCKEQDTLYCGTADLFGPYLLLPKAPGSVLCDTIRLVDVYVDSGCLTFKAVTLDPACGLQLHLDASKFLGGSCNSMYRLDLEIKQTCAGLENMGLYLVPPDNQIQQLDQVGAYWRCSFWVVDLDTLPPNAYCNYDKYGDGVLVWPNPLMDSGPGHCFVTPENPGSTANAPVVSLSTNAHQCASVASLPDLCVNEDWSGISQVKATIEGVGSFNLNQASTCDSGLLYVYEGTVALVMREEPYQILYEISDQCHNLDSVFCYILVKDATNPTAVAAQGVTVSLGGKIAWVKAETFDEGSFDACQINMLLARRSDWATAGIDLCNNLDTLCTAHDQIIYQPTLEENKDTHEIEAHYAKTIRWLEADGGPCANVILNAWHYGLLEQTYRQCAGGMQSEEAFRNHFKSESNIGCDLLQVDGESLGCNERATAYDRLLNQAAQIGGGWSQEVPFTCEDACQIIPVEILVIDYWCNWSKSWTEVRVEDKAPVTIVQDLTASLEITCNTFRNQMYSQEDSSNPWSLSEIVDAAANGETVALTALNDIFGGYQKVWFDNGDYVDGRGDPVQHELPFHDSVCVCKKVVQTVEIYDEHLGYVTFDSIYGACSYIDSIKTINTGLVGVNCAQNVQCTQTVWTDFDHCGQGYIYRKFKIWHGCPAAATTAGSHLTDTIERLQKIYVTNSCPLSRAMFDLPGDMQVYDCGIEYDPAGSGQVVGLAAPAVTGSPVYLFDDDCRILGVAHEDKVFKVVGGDQACYKIIRTWYFADWCASGRQAQADWWHNSLILDTYVQKILVIDTVPPVCLISGPVEEGGIVETAGCTYNLVADLDVMDACGLIYYQYELISTGASNAIQRGEGNLNSEIVTEASITVNDLTAGSYKLRVRVTDECQNESYCEYQFTILAGKKPSPVCITSMTLDLVAEDLDGDGIADTAHAVVWAKEFDRSSRAPCGIDDSELEFFLEVLRPDNPGFQSFDPAEDLDFVELGCEDVGVQTVRVWVLSPTESIDFCDVVLIVQQNQGGCPMVDPVFGTVEGRIVTVDDQSVEEVNLIGRSRQMPDQMTTTSAEGVYGFTFAMDDEVEVIPSKDGDDLNGINTADLLRLANHTNRSNPITNPYIRIAADIDFNKSIGIPDLLALRNIILGNVPGFVDGDSWRFVTADYQFQTLVPEGEPFLHSYQAALDKTVNQADFIAIKMGDLTLDRMTKKTGRAGDHLILSLEDRHFKTGDEILFAPRFEVNTEMDAMQFELAFDANALQFAGIDAGQLAVSELDFGIHSVASGRIYFSWIAAEHAFLDEQSPLFTLRLVALKDGTMSDQLALTANRLTAEVYQSAEPARPLSLFFRDKAPALVVSQNFPNPFRGETMVDFNLPEDSEVTFLVTDVGGKIIFEQYQQLAKGSHFISVMGSDLRYPGVYYYTIKTAHDIQTKKMALLR